MPKNFPGTGAERSTPKVSIYGWMRPSGGCMKKKKINKRELDQGGRESGVWPVCVSNASRHGNRAIGAGEAIVTFTQRRAVLIDGHGVCEDVAVPGTPLRRSQLGRSDGLRGPLWVWWVWWWFRTCVVVMKIPHVDVKLYKECSRKQDPPYSPSPLLRPLRGTRRWQQALAHILGHGHYCCKLSTLPSTLAGRQLSCRNS